MEFEVIYLLLVGLLQVHYLLVLYAHYKNADKVKSEGGCEPDHPDIQMGGVTLPNTDHATGRSVQHAVDDSDLSR